MISEVNMAILACEWDLSSGQYSLDVDLILAVSVQVEQVQTIKAISDANIGQSVKLSTDGVVLNTLPPAVKLKIDKEITGILEFAQEGAAPVQTVLDITTDVKLNETELTKGKLVTRGAATLEVLYEDEELAVKVQSFVQALPFELVFEGPEIQGGMALQPRLKAQSEGYVVNDGKSVRVELKLAGAILLRDHQPLQILTEITAPGNQVEVRKELVAVDSFVNRKEQQATA
ncbi:MAG TPA: hypothetical protein DDW87_09930, partial [Firmicutes bacterium]|nr:hypothetical protein [Bacillota bacterium]